SLIRFALAKRDSVGRPTTGIVRKSSATIIGLDEPQAIKDVSTGGSKAWPTKDYYNIWVGESENGLLGIAPEIGPGTNSDDGVCINYLVFSNNNCYSDPTFSLARTAVHEIGHNFGLFHIFEGGCNDEDFQQLTSPNLSLPDELLSRADDTPPQRDETMTCPSGTVTSGCTTSPNPLGKMYQNFMDYTEDACYSMFTKGQVERMHYVLENFRSGYLNSLGAVPVTAPLAFDVSVFESVNPGGAEVNGCTPFSYPSTLLCNGNIAPKFRIRNNGTTTITSLTVGYKLNNGNTVTQIVTINLKPNATTVVSFPAVPVSTGVNEFQFFTSSPNGQDDLKRSNDTLVSNLTIASPTTSPINESFETTFPPPGWTVSNPDNSITWQKANIGRNSSASAYINNFNYSSFEQKDDLYTPTFQFDRVDSVKLNFDLSAAIFSNHNDWNMPFDTLEILVTKDCGNTFTSVYKKWGAELQTLGQPARPHTDEFFPISTSQWRSEEVDLTQFKDAGSILVAFRNTTNYENNIFIDNVRLRTRTIPAALREKGYLLINDRLNGEFALWLYQNHDKLNYLAVYNSVGKMVWKKEFNNNADAYIPVNLQGQPAGIYFVKWGFTGESRTVTERILIQ
ncbi:MAG TPA: zinc-dependent metalloprotease, partial [Flavisolibacter sp.]|nr:zinc-dependent metalloprotease [Flavisolibacter sp.]